MDKAYSLIIILFLSLFLLVSYQPVLAYDFQKDSGIKKTAEGTGHKNIKVFGTNNDFIGAIAEFVKILFSFLGVIFLLLTIYGGYLWMMSAGNEQQVAKAKKIVINAAIGLTIILSAYAITTLFQQFVENYQNEIAKYD